jgi:molybdenum cofactor cytidylyltransferase
VATVLDLEAVILAAGTGSRFGGGKLTAPFEGSTLIAMSLSAASAAPARSVTVICGADPKVELAAKAAGALIVRARDHAAGLSASLRAGLGSLPADCDGAFIFLGDMPRIPHAVLPLLAEALPGHAAAAPFVGDQRGHPVLLGREMFDEAMALTGDRGAGALLDRLGARLARVPTADPGVLFDVDLRPPS